MPFSETVILVEGVGQDMRVRTVALLKPHIHTIIERLHLNPADPSQLHLRTWENTRGERDLTRQLRVFREVLPPTPAEEVERPLYDELVIKEPLPFYADETPMGWRRKHLRKTP